MNRWTLGVAAAIALGVAFRFVGLEQHVFWHDEVYTKFFASGFRASDWKAVLFTGNVLDVDQVLAFQRPSPEKGVLDTILGLAHDEPQHPPLYYLLARMWVGFFGDGIGALRALSAVLSLTALPGMWAFCREATGSARTAWTGTALLAVSPFFILYAQEAREYALWSSLTLWACSALLAAVRITKGGGPSFAMWAGFSALTALSLYTAMSAVPVILAQIGFVVLSERGRFTRTSLSAAAAMAASAVAFLPWAAMIWVNLEAFQISMAWSRAVTVPQTEVIGTFLLNVSRPLLDFGVEYAPVGPATVISVAVGTLVIATSVAEFRQIRGRILIGLLAVIPIAMLVLPDLMFGGIRSLSARYLTASFLALQVMLAHALRERPAAFAIVVGLGLGSAVSNALQPAVWTKSISNDLPAVAEIINATPTPVVVGNMERHHPGNLLALCHLLKPGTKLQFLDHGVHYTVPTEFSDVFLFSPIQPFLEDLEARNPAKAEKLLEKRHLSLWRVEREQ